MTFDSTLFFVVRCSWIVVRCVAVSISSGFLCLISDYRFCNCFTESKSWKLVFHWNVDKQLSRRRSKIIVVKLNYSVVWVIVSFGEYTAFSSCLCATERCSYITWNIKLHADLCNLSSYQLVIFSSFCINATRQSSCPQFEIAAKPNCFSTIFYYFRESRKLIQKWTLISRRITMEAPQGSRTLDDWHRPLAHRY